MASAIFADIRAYVDKERAEYGDSIIFTIQSDMPNTTFPALQNIAGYRVLGQFSRQSYTNINGQGKNIIEKSYEFMPTKSMSIPSFDVDVEGTVHKTKPIKIELYTPKADKDEDLSFHLSASKQKLYVGENFKLTMQLKIKESLPLQDIRVQQPSFEGFWIKPLDNERTYRSGGYVIKEVSFIASAQKDGNLTMSPALAKVALEAKGRDFFGMFLTRAQWKTLLSNALEFEVAPLPSGVTLVGDFSIEAKVDKTHIKANEPVVLTLSIQGSGNVDDLPEFTLNIPNATIYEEKPQKKIQSDKENLTIAYSKNFSIIANQDFTIEPFVLRYFDVNTNSTLSKQTAKIAISVAAPKAQEETKIITAKPETVVKVQKDYTLTLFALIIGFILGLFSTYLFGYLKNKKSPKKKRAHSLPSSDQELLRHIMPYVEQNKELSRIAEQLYSDIKAKQASKVDKEHIKKLLDRIKNQKIEPLEEKINRLDAIK